MKFISDMVFVGSGLSSTYTLIHYLLLLNKSASNQLIKVLIIEKSNEFWTGIPYSAKAGYSSLIITSLKEFIPDPERSEFTSWLKKNIKTIFNDFLDNGGDLSERWMKKNKKAIDNNQWDDIFIPRYIFGLFLKNRVEVLLEEAVKNSKIEYAVNKAHVLNIEKEKEFYKITACGVDNTKTNYYGKKVILSIGSPPKNYTDSKTAALSSFCLINDFYEPEITENVKKIQANLEQSDSLQQNNVLIIGSNASALEVIYNLNDFPDLKGLINKFYVLSSAGTFPNRIDVNITDTYVPESLTQLKSYKTFTSKKIYEAVKKDVAFAEHKNRNIADTFSAISTLVIELLNRLNSYQQKRFVAKYGVEIGSFRDVPEMNTWM